MKQIFFLIAFVSISISTFADGIEFFHGTLDEAKVKAQKENKLIFIDCYTTWCAPCKMLAKFVFTDGELGNFNNEHFINLKLDMEKEGAPVAYKYGISAYPTLLYIDYTGAVKKKLVGGRDAKALIEEGRDAIKPDANTLRKMENRYLEGIRDTEFLYNYVKILAQAGKSYEVELREYLSILPEKNLLNEKTTKLMMDIANHVNSASTKHILKNSSIYKERYGAQIYDELIIRIAKKNSQDAVKNKDRDAFNKGQTMLTDAKVKDAKKVQLTHEMIWTETVQDWHSYAVAGSKYIAKYAPKDTAYVKSFVEKVERSTLNEPTLLLVLKEAKRLLKLQSNFDHHLLAAKVYHKLQQYEKALEETKSALNDGGAEDTSEARSMEEIIKKSMTRRIIK